MSFEAIIILLAVGLTAGLLAGIFGIGGGIIIVPSLLFVYELSGFESDMSMHIAIATSLFTIIFTTIASSYKHTKNNNINWKTALIIGTSSAVSVFIFTKLAVLIDGDVLKKIFSIVLILISIRMFFSNAAKDNKKQADSEKNNTGIIMIIGFLSGIISAFTGLGGGIVVVPMMHYMLNFSIKRSIGTSSAAILITAFSGVIGFIVNAPDDAVLRPNSLGLVDALYAIPIVIGSIPMSQLGAHLHKKSSPNILTKMFSIFVFSVALYILFK